MQSPGTSPAASLNEENKAARHLLDLLKMEQTQLINADIEGLSVLTEEKAKIVARMTELAMQRHKKLGAAGFAAKETGMQDWLQSPEASATALTSWSELIALAKAAKELNRTNGMLIGKHLSNNQMALNILHGSATGAGNFYGPNGQATMRTSVRGVVVG